jgi:hypothetical protein
MKKSFLITILISLSFLLGNTSKGSVIFSTSPAGGNSGSTEWVLQTTNGNVEFYYKIDECNGQKAVFLKFVNKNNYKVEVKWEEVYADKKSGKSFDNFEGKKHLVISPNATLQASCNSTECTECLILSSMVSPVQVVDVQQFDFKNITVNVIK